MSDRFELRGVVAPTLMLLVMAGCGGGDGGGASGGGGGAAAVENPVDAATAGNIAGSVVFEGAVPSMDDIDMSSESVCAAKHASTPMVQEVVVNSNGTLANVFVYVKEGLESLQFPTPEAVLLNPGRMCLPPARFGRDGGSRHHDQEQRRAVAQHQRIARHQPRLQQQPARQYGDHSQLRSCRGHGSSALRRSRLDERLCRRPRSPVSLRVEQQWRLQPVDAASGRLRDRGVARALRNADPERDSDHR